MTPGIATDLFGLGQAFVPAAEAGSWVGKVREPGNSFGNEMTHFSGGKTGNTQIPFALALGPGSAAYGLFVDSVAGLTWDLSGEAWTVEASFGPLAGYVLAGPSPLDVRADYMELTGESPLPPRPAFGLWLSEYGYETWDEARGKLDTLTAAGFPIDGVVFDLQWFGGIEPREASQMGTLTWDEEAFPEPKKNLAALVDTYGTRAVVIEESYVAKNLASFQPLLEAGFLLRNRRGRPPILNSWWGDGQMLDWTSAEVRRSWHETKRAPLIDAGVFGHWTDLGEPEDFTIDARYDGGKGELGGDVPTEENSVAHERVHNLYNFWWAQGIAEGYARDRRTARPWILSRSGTAGIQRFGVAMWSGDIGTNVESLAAHIAAQAHVVASGIDYYGSDVGGFIRGDIQPEDLEPLYTAWLATAAMLDVPVRPHVANFDNRFETAPDRVGESASNLANLRLRYALVPTYYTLAQRAEAAGTPVVAPLWLHYPGDQTARNLADHKALGADLVTVAVPDGKASSADVYLPEGRWLGFHDHTWRDGGWHRGYPLRHDGLFRLPLFLRRGAIVPMAPVDAQTMNTLGRRRDGSRATELVLRIVAGPRPTELEVYEDDGLTLAYRDGALRTTPVRQAREPGAVRVQIGPARGSYRGAPEARPVLVDLSFEGGEVVAVSHGGSDLTEVSADSGLAGWWSPMPGRVKVRLAPAPVTEPHSLVVSFGTGDR